MDERDQGGQAGRCNPNRASGAQLHIDVDRGLEGQDLHEIAGARRIAGCNDVIGDYG
jgi:hypothetical protein